MEAQPFNDNDDSDDEDEGSDDEDEDSYDDDSIADDSAWSDSSSSTDSSSTNSTWSEYSSLDASTDDDSMEEEALEIWTGSFGEAARRLESSRGRAVSCLFVSSAPGRRGAEADANLGAAFARFVLGLENAKCNLRAITFENLDWHGLPDGEMDRLFGTVLPAHSTLGAVQFVDSVAAGWHLPVQRVVRLASSIPGNSPLTSVNWEGGRIDRAAALAIADMIRRDPPHLAHLVVTPTSSGGLDRDSLKIICDAVPHNKSMRRLEVRAKEVFADSLDGAAGPGSSLTHLCVYSTEPFSRVGVTGLAKWLTTNTELTDLQLFQEGGGSDAMAAALRPSLDARGVVLCLLDALDKCNFTLTSLTVTDPDRLMYELEDAAAFLARNRWIQHVLEELEVTDDEGAKVYKLEPAGLWPHAMEVTSGTPTPLYRLLRRGAVKDRSFSTHAVREGTTAPLNATEPVAPPQIQLPPLHPWLQQQMTCLVQQQELVLGLLQQQTEHQQRHYDLHQRHVDLQPQQNGAGSGSGAPGELRQVVLAAGSDVERADAAPLDYVETCPSSSDEVLTTGEEADDDTSVYFDAEQGLSAPS